MTTSRRRRGQRPVGGARSPSVASASGAASRSIGVPERRACRRRRVRPRLGRVASAPVQSAGDGREVVGGGGAEHAGRPGAGRRVLEVDEPGAEDAVGGERLADALLDGAEVLAHHERPAPGGLDGEDGEQFVGVRADVGAVGGIGAGRDPEQTEQAEHVVDPQPAAVAHVGPHGTGERLVPRCPQRVRDVGREAPVLAVGGELVRRRADAGVEREQVLVGPGVGAAGVDADREVGDQRARPGRIAELAVGDPLEPGVEPDVVGVVDARTGARRRCRGGAARRATAATVRDGSRRWRRTSPIGRGRRRREPGIRGVPRRSSFRGRRRAVATQGAWRPTPRVGRCGDRPAGRDLRMRAVR